MNVNVLYESCLRGRWEKGVLEEKGKGKNVGKKVNKDAKEFYQ